MKTNKALLLTTLLFTTTLSFADKPIWYITEDNRKHYATTTNELPQISKHKKSKKNYKFILSGTSNAIIDEKNKQAWSINTNHNTSYRRMDCKNYLDTNSLKQMDFNAVTFILKKIINTSDIDKDLPIWVKTKNIDINKHNKSDFKTFSITKNKFLPKKSAYTLCEDTSYEDYLRFHKKSIQEINQKVLDIKRSKSIKVSDMTDQGMVIEIKGAIVKIQVVPKNAYPYTRWFKKDELSFKNERGRF